MMNSTDYEVLAMRLLLAFLSDDAAEITFQCWAIMDQSGCDKIQFQVAARTAREAASWWKEHDAAEDGRAHILAKLKKLTVSA